jgi:hypothetical protein
MPHKLDYKTPIVRQPSKPAYLAFVSVSTGVIAFAGTIGGGALPEPFGMHLLTVVVCAGFLLGVGGLFFDPEKPLACLGMMLNGTALAVLGCVMLLAQWRFGGSTW